MGLTTHAISNGVLTAQVTDFGASLMDLRLAGVGHGLVLGYPHAEDYLNDGQFMGAVIGRYANRIAGGHVPWEPQTLTLECNENGTNHLHGGADGFGRQVWTVAAVTPTSVTFQHLSPDGHAGYPGDLKATATYEVTGTTLRLTLCATCDKDTIVNLCHHPYFTLDGQPDIRDHVLSIHAPSYLPGHPNLVPTGEVAKLSGSDFDYRTPKPVSHAPVNNTYCLHADQAGPLSPAATLQAGKVRMAVHTTQPGVHYYNGYKLSPKAIGHHGRAYDACAGICLEAQAWPDSCNHPHFPNVAVRAGQLYEQVTEYRFSLTQNT